MDRWKGRFRGRHNGLGFVGPMRSDPSELFLQVGLGEDQRSGPAMGAVVRIGHEVAAFIRMMGLWWGDLMTSLREHAASRQDPAE